MGNAHSISLQRLSLSNGFDSLISLFFSPVSIREKRLKSSHRLQVKNSSHLSNRMNFERKIKLTTSLWHV